MTEQEKAALVAELENDELRQRLANAEHQLYMKDLAIHNVKASRKAQFRKRREAETELARLKAQEPVAHSWINGLVIPESAMTASYDPGAGTVICAVAEVDEALQAEGYPVLCLAYLDVVPRMMIDQSTNSNITSHVVRWLPVARVNNDD